MQTKEVPLVINNNPNLYSDFGSRLGAGLLDGLIMSPVWVTALIINSQSLSVQYFTLAFNSIFSLWYMVYLTKRYGGTPGKLVSGLKIIRMDGGHIGWREAFLRYSVSLFISLMTTVGAVYALTQADAGTYDSLGWMEQTRYLQSFNSGYQTLLVWISCGWLLAETIVFFTNDRRRAIHDIIAGTVVVKKIYHKEIIAYMGEGLSANDRGEAAFAE